MARAGRGTKSVGAKISQGRSASSGESDRGSLWFRMADEYWWAVALWAERRSTPMHPVLMGEVREAAIEEFLADHAAKSFSNYLAPARTTEPKRTIWLPIELLSRIDAMAERDGVSRARLVDTALLLYLRKLGLTASAKEVSRLKAQQEAAGGRSWRVVRKEGARPTEHDLRVMEKSRG